MKPRRKLPVQCVVKNYDVVTNCMQSNLYIEKGIYGYILLSEVIQYSVCNQKIFKHQTEEYKYEAFTRQYSLHDRNAVSTIHHTQL